MDDPDVEAITELRKEGYITRTRINTETEVDADRYQKALDSGSQIISFGTVLNSSFNCIRAPRTRTSRFGWVKTVKKIKSIAIPGAYLKTMSRVFKLIIDHLIGYQLHPININLKTIIRNVPSRKLRSEKYATGMIRFIIKEFKLILFILWKIKKMVGSEMIDNEQENVKELCNYIWYM